MMQLLRAIICTIIASILYVGQIIILPFVLVLAILWWVLVIIVIAPITLVGVGIKYYLDYRKSKQSK